MNVVKAKQRDSGATFFQLFKQSPQFTALLLGQMFSLLGSSITNVILPIIVLRESKSAAMMGTVMAIYMVPFIFLLPFSGVLVDKMNKVRVMIFADLVRFGLMLTLALITFFDQFHMLTIFIIMFFMGIMESFFQPAYSGVRAKVFIKEIRNAANSITQVMMQSLKLLGPIIGGIIVSVFSASWGFGIDAVTYIISFIFLLTLRSISFQRDSNQTQAKSSIRKDFREGIEVIKQQSWLWITILVFSFINIFWGGIIKVLLPWLINIHYKFEPTVFGLVISASGAGAVVCGVIFGIRKKWNNRGILTYTTVAITGLSLLLLPAFASVPFIMLLMFINGASNMLGGLIWETSLQELVPEEKFGRVASLDMLGTVALLPAGYLLTGWIAEGIGEITTLIAFSSAIAMIGVVVLLNKSIRAFD
ncbi:MFS transporter [Bacillus sp. FJAT-49736]|uniref:MFS transporter n=1 Tax=Bacillus sp. FJAT-49736 TaxID=2833582 RepID=UPI001BC9BB43|nr:MFS transporter [Bacillus sp. FJAT-49736]MBS4175598.1 MFS transporter [Bacillus sp. FJAT-49736]